MPVQLLHLFFLELSKKIWQKFYLFIHLSSIHPFIPPSLPPSTHSPIYLRIHPTTHYPSIPGAKSLWLLDSAILPLAYLPFPCCILEPYYSHIPTSSCHLVPLPTSFCLKSSEIFLKHSALTSCSLTLSPSFTHLPSLFCGISYI